MADDFVPAPETFQLHLDGFDGPLSLLLDLARRQQVDLAHISISTLVDQYVDAISSVDKVDVGRAAEWLVMAAWLTWLKSRLLLPKNLAETKEAEQAAQVLTDRLAALDRVRAVTAWLDARPQLGRDIFGRGQTETWSDAVVTADYQALFEACLSVLQERQGRPLEQYRPMPPRTLWTPAHALVHMQGKFLEEPQGGSFLRLLPGFPASLPDRAFHIRSAVASTLIATLELARAGHITAQQDETFGPIKVVADPAYIDLHRNASGNSIPSPDQSVPQKQAS